MNMESRIVYNKTIQHLYVVEEVKRDFTSIKSHTNMVFIFGFIQDFLMTNFTFFLLSLDFDGFNYIYSRHTSSSMI